MRLLNKLQGSRDFWFLLTTSFIFFLLRLPSLFEPYWYGDEGIYEVIGFALRHGRLLYSGIWDNKPPMLYLIYAIFNGSQGPTRFLSLLAGLGAVWTIFFLSKKLFQKNMPVYITTGIFAFFFAIPLIEGNIANAENFMLFPGILAGWLVFKTILNNKHTNIKNKLYKIQNTKYFMLGFAGLLLGISFLIKIVALFDLSAFAVFVFIAALSSFSVKNIVKAIIQVIPLIVGFSIPLLLCCLFFFIHGTFGEFLHSTLFSNVGYVNYANQFIIPQGFLILRTLIVALIVLFFLVRRKTISHTTLFIFLWLAFSIYSALFSGRPYTHYALVMLPAFSLLVGLVFINTKARFIAGITFIIFLIFVAHSFTFYSHPFTYYQNFIAYTLGQKSENNYQAFFDHIVPRDYAIAAYINEHKKPGQTLFVWGNSGQLYKMTNTLPPGRFIVAYHVTMTSQNTHETQEALQKNPPSFIIVLQNASVIPFSLSQYKEKIIIDNAVIYEHTI